MQEREVIAGPGLVSRETGDYGNRRRISWGAIFAGTLVAISIQLLLTLLGIAIGAWLIDPEAGADRMQGIGIGAGIWALLSFIIALFVGGCVAGRMAGVGTPVDGMIEGVVVWSTVTLLTFMLLTTTIGSILGGAAGLARYTVTTAGEQVRDPGAVARDIEGTLRDLAQDPEVRRDVEETAVEVGGEVARATGTGSFWAFIALLIGMIAAAFGGRAGRASTFGETSTVRDRTVVR